jgi:tRNA1Val (adenine37-N6)-methyltransferase
MWDYDQPDWYRFSSDSLDLINYVKEEFEAQEVLDMGSGCGILGLELLREGAAKRLTAIEIQPEFSIYFLQNVKALGLEERCQLINAPVEAWSLENRQKKFDLIVSNPPYFLSGHGRPSPSVKKNRCRFLDQVEWKTWVELIAQHLSKNGRAYLLSRLPLPQSSELKVKKEIEISGACLRVLTRLNID